MAQGYVLVLRPSDPSNKDSEKKYYAVSKSTGEVDLNYLGKLIAARSAVSSADVKSVLDNLNFFTDLELQEGKIIRWGELGSFRITVGSEGVKDKTKFNASMVWPSRLVFTPGADLKGTKRLLKFSHVGETGEKSNDGESDGDKPSEL
ncbi:HU family DNA-binding protein [Parabacteroides sp. APC149_11_2_Y6]